MQMEERENIMKRIGWIVISALCVCANSLGADWPQLLGPTRNNVSPETGLLKTWPAEGPKVLWTFPLGEGYGGAAILDGKVYVLDRIPGKQDVLRCVGLKTGKEEWSYPYDAPGNLDPPGSRCVPTVTKDRIYTVGSFGDVHCLDTATHKVVWHKNLLKEFGGKLPTWGINQSPLLYKKSVIVAPLTPQAGVAALDPKTGDVQWKSAPLQGGMGYVSPQLAKFGGVDQIVISTTKQTAGVDAQSGKILWTYEGWQCKIPIPTPTIIGKDQVFLTGEYGAGSAMLKIEKKGNEFACQELFKTKVCESQIHQPIVIGDYIYANSNGNDRREGLICMDLQGNLKWRTQREPNFERGNLILADGMIYIIDGVAGTLHLVKPDPAGFKEVSKVKILEGESIWAPMALSNGLLVIRDQKEMKCLDVKG